MEKPLLSICIPTYNRADCLRRALESIVDQDRFEEIEIVISDNCSTDNTNEIGLHYSGRYRNIRYHRNARNLRDENFAIVLSLANGMLRKLSNDTLEYEPGAVSRMLDCVENNLSTRPVIYFTNEDKLVKCIGSGGMFKCNNADEFLRMVGHKVTWIGSVALWDEDCKDSSRCISAMRENAHTCLGQIPCVVEMIKEHGAAVVYGRQIMHSLKTKEKKNLSYGLYEVFYKNYLAFMEVYWKDGVLTEDTYLYLKKEIGINFFALWIPNLEVNKDKYTTNGENLRELVKREYMREPYYKEYKLKLMKNSVWFRFLRIYHNVKRK